MLPRYIRAISSSPVLHAQIHSPMRHIHPTLMRELEIDPKADVDERGHPVDINFNTHTQTGLGQRNEAVNTLEPALAIM